MTRRSSMVAFAAALLALAPCAASAQDGAATFNQSCASCHSIGQGVRVGPDLAGAHERRSAEWLHNFIKTPSSMLDSDPAAQALVTQFNGVRMPDLGLDDATVDALIEYITRCSTEDCSGDTAGGLRPVAESTARDIEQGRKLFTGEVALSNGGPACISCHSTDSLGSLGGGTLARDLTQAFVRLGEGGIDGALTGTPFPQMNAIYPARPLTTEEANDLKAYLANASRQAPRRSNAAAWYFPLIGLGGLAVALVSINAAWGRRLKRGVRRPLVEKPTRRMKGRVTRGDEQ